MKLDVYLAEPGRGRAARLARALAVHPVNVSEWGRGRKPIPADRCPFIEAESEGAVPCEEQRPDLVWVRVPDPAWPWHALGRPLRDLVAERTHGPLGPVRQLPEADHAA
jgi:hypothetical protein